MLAEKGRGNGNTVLDILFAEGELSHTKSSEIKHQAEAEKKTASEILLTEGAVSETTLAEAISRASNIPYIDLKSIEFERSALKYVKQQDAVSNLMVPFQVDENKLKIAIFDLSYIKKNDPKIFQRIRATSNIKVDLYISDLSEIRYLQKYYQQKENVKMVKAETQKGEVNQKRKEKDVLDILQAQDMIDFKQAQELRQESEKKGIKLGDLLSEKGVVDEEELTKAYSDLFNIPFVRLVDKKIPYEIIAKFPEEISKKYHVVAFDMIGTRVIKVATSRPFDLKVIELLDYIEDKNELEVDKYVTPESDIESALESYETKPKRTDTEPKADFEEEKKPEEDKNKEPEKTTIEKPTPQVPEPPISEEKKEEERPVPVAEGDIGRLLKEDIKNLGQLEEIIREGSVPKIVAATINFALFKRASDIHIQPGEKKLRIRYRIDGVLNDITNIPLELHPAIVSRIKILSKLRIDEKRIPQDGRFEVVFGKTMVDIRVSTLPTTHGEKVVMRLLDTSGGAYSLKELGLSGRAYQVFEKNITKPYGMIIATGPTGSGKSTTLYSALNYINKPEVNIVTLEDPVEYDIQGINQSQAKPDIGYNFADGLRSILRQDPDVVMVGEIRDKETAGMAIHAALTGHLVFSSLHTNDASGAIPRLIDMGIEPFLIISAINVFLAQRLVRKICDKCKTEDDLPPSLIKKIEHEISMLPDDIKSKYPKPHKFYKGKGCKYCNQGYFGRIGIFEVMPMTENIRKLSVETPTATLIKKSAMRGGMLTMMQDGITKALEGTTTIEEVLRVTIS